MKLDWIFELPHEQRFTQDSPVMADVWLAFWDAPGQPVDLLLTPHADSTSAALASALIKALPSEAEDERELAYNESYVVARLRFDALVRVALPLSRWWGERIAPGGRATDLGSWVGRHRPELARAVAVTASERDRSLPRSLPWFVGLVGRMHLPEPDDDDEAQGPEAMANVDPSLLVARAAEVLKGVPARPRAEEPMLWSVNLNRTAEPALWSSRVATKADAANRVFDLSCAELRWGVIDSGVDASHPAFRCRNDDEKESLKPLGQGAFDDRTRVVRAYDFTRLRPLIAGKSVDGVSVDEDTRRHLKERLTNGRLVDWSLLEPLLRVAREQPYKPPGVEHGTHVAGILGGDWRQTDSEPPPVAHEIVGLCPDIELYDLRVFDDEGHSDEWAITGAMQFVRHLNAYSDLQVIHGVNLSLSIEHAVRNYACGRTPVCDEANRLAGSGVVVVAAAGNQGRATYSGPGGSGSEGYRTVSITDPGNADDVLTVGATHRDKPHTYGVSYFSSRGPTGDGRLKPDLVAPGEKITAPIPNAQAKEKDGTSQAAPHVSAAAALLMARHKELIGAPLRVKQILCDSATDLGRERYFQGAGMLDVLRAIQSV